MAAGDKVVPLEEEEKGKEEEGEASEEDEEAEEDKEGSCIEGDKDEAMDDTQLADVLSQQSNMSQPGGPSSSSSALKRKQSTAAAAAAASPAAPAPAAASGSQALKKQRVEAAAPAAVVAAPLVGEWTSSPLPLAHWRVLPAEVQVVLRRTPGYVYARCGLAEEVCQKFRDAQGKERLAMWNRKEISDTNESKIAYGDLKK